MADDGVWHFSVAKNYERYAEMAGVCPYWIRKIKEEIDCRIDNLTGVSHYGDLSE